MEENYFNSVSFVPFQNRHTGFMCQGHLTAEVNRGRPAERTREARRIAWALRPALRPVSKLKNSDTTPFPAWQKNRAPLPVKMSALPFGRQAYRVAIVKTPLAYLSWGGFFLVDSRQWKKGGDSWVVL